MLSKRARLHLELKKQRLAKIETDIQLRPEWKTPKGAMVEQVERCAAGPWRPIKDAPFATMVLIKGFWSGTEILVVAKKQKGGKWNDGSYDMDEVGCHITHFAEIRELGK